jgi:hypothetical protein
MMNTSGGLFDEHGPKGCDSHTAILIKGEIQQLWDRTVVHIRQAMEVLHNAMKVERGPDPDFDPSVQVMQDLTRAILGLRRLRGHQNGDGDEKLIKRWHLIATVVTLLFTVIGAAWRLSEQMSDQFAQVRATQASQTTSIENIREHQREQDDRSTRIEEQLRELATRPRAAGP